MILQLGLSLAALSGPALSAAASQAAAAAAGPTLLGSLTAGLQTLGGQIITQGLDLGKQYVSGLIQKELNRDAVNAIQNTIKNELRAAANVVSPTVAPGQTAVFSGGPAVGSAFQPSTVLPPSISPPSQILQINPEFSLSTPRAARPVTTSAGQVVKGIQPLTLFGQPMAQSLSPFMFQDPATGGGPAFGTRIMEPLTMANGNGALALAGPQLPVRHRYTRNMMNTGSQVFVPSTRPGIAPNMVPIEQAPALGVPTNGCRYRFDLLKGEFVKIRQRRLNPSNMRAFFRAGRRIDSMERICRKLFSERRREKTAVVKRKRRARRKK